MISIIVQEIFSRKSSAMEQIGSNIRNYVCGQEAIDKLGSLWYPTLLDINSHI